MQPSFTIPLHKSNIHSVPLSPWLVSFLLLALISLGPYVLSVSSFWMLQQLHRSWCICWSFFNSSRYSVIPFILFVSFSMYSFRESLIPLSSTVTLPNIPFRQFDPIISCCSFTICFAIRKVSFWRLWSFKSLAHSFCFVCFALVGFMFHLLFLYSFHASVDLSFFHFPYS